MTARERQHEAARERVRARLEAIVGPGPMARFDEALTHRSYANETSEPDNQRLEFLGDAVLGLCVSEMLAQERPDADEGTLTRMRSALVNAEALARWARAEELGDAIAFGKGAQTGSERAETNVLADAVEALVACVYDAHGLEGARRLVADVVKGLMTEAATLDSRDPKSLLQEAVQAHGGRPPTYRVKAMHGPPDPSFEVEVLVDGEVVGVGEGRSKKLAERSAAQQALLVRGAPPLELPAGVNASPPKTASPPSPRTPENESYASAERITASAEPPTESTAADPGPRPGTETR